MNFEISNLAVAILPVLLFIVLNLGFIALGLFVTYLIIRAAINHSKLNQNVEALRGEITRMNENLQQLQSYQESSTKSEVRED